MNDLLLIIVGGIIWYAFWGPHTKPKEKKDDKGGKGEKK